MCALVTGVQTCALPISKCSRRPASRPSAARRWRTCSMAKNEGKGGTVKVRLVKGLRGSQAKHRLSVKALGLNKLNAVRELKDSPQVRGLINKVHYLVQPGKASCRDRVCHDV